MKVLDSRWKQEFHGCCGNELEQGLRIKLISSFH